MIEHSSGAIEYQEQGTGTTLLFVPGSFATGATWRHVIKPLSARYRIVTTSLLGYGDTQERRQPGSAAIQHEIDALEEVVARAGSPVHIVGHSFGAWVVLAYAMQCKSPPLSLTLLEPPASNLLHLAGEADLDHQFHAMTDGYIAAWQNGDQQSARHVIDFYGGEGSFDAFPQHVQDYIIQHTPTNLLDWETGYGDMSSAEDLGRVTAPALVVCGEQSHLAVQRSNELLGQWLPNAAYRTLANANHFMIGSHPAELAQLIDSQVMAAEVNRS